MNPLSIAAVMITVDRSPKENYLDETLTNLTRGGAFAEQTLHSLSIVNSTQKSSHFPATFWRKVRRPLVRFHITDRDYLACENANPSFVEHIGRESVCTNHVITHRSPSWAGKDWSYV